MRGRGSTRLATLGLGLVLALGASARPAPPPGSKLQTVDHPKRTFRIPIEINKTDLVRYKSIQLWASNDAGGTWIQVGTTTIDNPYFTFRAPRDGDYLFAVRMVDNKGRVLPPDDAPVEPLMRVTVDTLSPYLSFEALPRRGNIASVRWEMSDEHLDLGSFSIQYQVDGSSDWIKVPIRKVALVGSQKWDAGTAEPIRVRATVSDRAGNTKSIPLEMKDGSADGSDPNSAPPMGTFASSGPDRAPAAIPSAPPAMPSLPDGDNTGYSRPATASASGEHNPFAAGEPAPGRPTAPPRETVNPPILVTSPKFGLQYAIDDAGPNGPAAVEIYVTTDGGQTWFPKGEDPDRASPFPVDLGGEGTFGLKLVAKSAANQGDRPPLPGEAPLTIVEVDGSGPTVKLEPPKIVGTKLVIAWQASDPHPAPRPVMISVRAEGPESTNRWQLITPSPIENTGQFQWTVPANCPAKLHVRVDVRDSLGNQSSADTTETGAVLVDRSKPKGRILGLDTSTKSVK